MTCPGWRGVATRMLVFPRSGLAAANGGLGCDAEPIEWRNTGRSVNRIRNPFFFGKYCHPCGRGYLMNVDMLKTTPYFVVMSIPKRRIA